MITMGSIRRGVLALSLAATMLALPAVARAVVSRPWWHLATISAPAAADSEEARIDVVADNVGDGPTVGTTTEHEEEALLHDETKGFVTVVDKLPPGVTATGAYAQGGGEDPGWYDETGFDEKLKFFESFGFPVPKPCSISGQTAECEFVAQVHPYEQLLMEMTVKVAPGAGRGENEVAVSGGGAPSASSRRPLGVEAVAPFGVQTYELSPEEEGGIADTQAGSHPFQLTATLMLNTEAAQVRLTKESDYPPGFDPEIKPIAFAKDLRFDLPPGLVGNPTPLPKCSLHTFLQFNESDGKTLCPNNTVVGVATPIVTTFQPDGSSPRAASEPLYILEPSVGEPAKFGFPTLVGPVILDISVRTGGKYEAVVSAPNITQSLAFIGDEVTFWGVPADPRHDNSRNNECLSAANAVSETESSCPVDEKPQPLLIMPTSCTGPLHTTVEADSWAQIGQFTSDEYTFANAAGEPAGEDGCSRLNFEPSISVAPDGQQGSEPTGLTVGVHVAQEASLNPEGLAESAVKDTTVTLPVGVALNPSGADGLFACGEAEVGLGSAGPSACPEASKVGTVEIHTPLLPNPLVGAAYLAQQNANPFGSLIALYIVAYDPVSGVRVKLAGQVTPNPVTGQLVSTFKETPQLPFESLAINFFGGSRAPLGTPALCGGYTTTASIAPWSGNAPTQSSSEFEITSGPNGAPCADPLPFNPTLNAGTTSIQAGGFSPFTMAMSREDGEQGLQSVRLKMPPGLLGMLASVKLCGEPQADEGACGEESLIGETTVSVGLGGDPYSVKGGKVYVTGPYQGAPYGLSIVNPAKAGPLDVEHDTSNPNYDPPCDCLVVRAKIEVNQETSQLTITTDPSGPYAIPHILDGIPLQIKHVNVTINRPGFTFNPTNCSPLQIGGSLGSDEGTSAALAVPFQVTNCAALSFKPEFKVSTSAKTSRVDGASLHATLTLPSGAQGTKANVAKVKVSLPKQLPSPLKTLQKACTEKVFAENPANCPVASKIGEATVQTPVLEGPLLGPVYFVSHGGARYPELIIVLKGEDGVTVQVHGETLIKNGITTASFNTVPDVPFSGFELTLPEREYPALSANGNLCKGTLLMPTEMVAQNGLVIKQSTKISVTGCPKTKKATHKRSRKHKAAKHGKGKKHGGSDRARLR